MGLCEKHCHFYKNSSYCEYCFKENKNANKETDKKQYNNLLITIQQQHNKKMKSLFVHNNKLLCHTCPTEISISKSGIWSMHWGHYFDKSIYWYFMFHPMNGLPQCYNCNNNLNGNKILLEQALIKKHGNDNWNLFKAEVQAWYEQMKQGIYSVKPTLEFLINNKT